MRPSGYSQRSPGAPGATPHTHAIPGQERRVCPAAVHCSPFELLAGNQAPGPEQRDLYAAPLPARAPRACFLFILCCLDSMGRNSAPLPRCGDTSILSPQGLPRHWASEGERQGRSTKTGLCAVPGASRARRADRSQPEPRWAEEMPVPPPGDPSGSQPGRGVPWMKRVPWGQGGAGAAFPSGPQLPGSPLKAESFSGRFSSSLYFWSQRNSCRGESSALDTAPGMEATHTRPQQPGLARQRLPWLCPWLPVSLLPRHLLGPVPPPGQEGLPS